MLRFILRGLIGSITAYEKTEIFFYKASLQAINALHGFAARAINLLHSIAFWTINLLHGFVARIINLLHSIAFRAINLLHVMASRVINLLHSMALLTINLLHGFVARIINLLHSIAFRAINLLHGMASRVINLLHNLLKGLPVKFFLLNRWLLCLLLLQVYKFISFFKKKPEEARSVLQLSIVSNKQYMLSRLLRDHGVKSDFFALNTDLVDMLTLGYDYNLPYRIHPLIRRLWEIYYLWILFARYDVIHSHFNALLSLDDGWELKYLRKMGKVLVFHFRGCDLRQRGMNMSKNPGLNCCQECDYPEGSCDTEYQRRRLSKAQEYGDLFFVTTPDLKDFFQDAKHIPFISPYGINLGEIKPAQKIAGVFRVVTSSNHPGLDGVPYIGAAVQRLKDEGRRIELVEVSNTPYREALAIYKSANLFAGKLRMGYYNNANIETMMMGIPNMAYIREEYLKDIPDCPIIIARPENIYEKIKEWMDKPDELKRVGALGPAFVKKYHDPHMVIQILIKEYNQAFKRSKAGGFKVDPTSQQRGIGLVP